MSVVEFNWGTALTGGVLIGLSALILMVTIGRIAGVSGIFANVLKFKFVPAWHWAFIVGLLFSGLVFHWLYRPIVIQVDIHVGVLVLAGMLVGYGSRLGSGCTSGHGVCGIGRLSLRSVVATCVFIGVGMLTVFFCAPLFGGLR